MEARHPCTHTHTFGGAASAATGPLQVHLVGHGHLQDGLSDASRYPGRVALHVHEIQVDGVGLLVVIYWLLVICC